MKILIVGGGGYVGSVVSKYLSKFDQLSITVIDNFIYHNQNTNVFLNHNRINLLKCRFEDFNFEKNFKYDVVIFFAGLVGDPITKNYPILSIKINENSIIKFISKLYTYNFDKFIFISTCSNYGLMPENTLATEESPLKPLSLYAKSKVKIENFLLDNKSNNFSKTILRFSTAFGLSDRMRLDLTVNQFIYEAKIKKELLVYDADTWRPYCHLNDFAETIFHVITLDNSLIKNQVFNVGLDENNSTKRMLVDKIKNLNFDFKCIYSENGNDPRNYRVSFKKINQVLGFIPKYNLEYGFEEINNWLNKMKSQKINYNDLGNYLIPQEFINLYF